MALLVSAAPVQAPKRCYLLEMPPELRLNIYDILFDPQQYVFFIGNEIYYEREYISGALTVHGTMLLQTCREIHQEAFPVFYDKCLLRIYCMDDLNTMYNSEHRREMDTDGLAMALKCARKVKVIVQRNSDETISGLTSSITRVLSQLEFGRSLRDLELLFGFIVNAGEILDDQSAVFKVFENVQCSGTVRMDLHNLSVREATTEQRETTREKYDQLVELLKA